MKTILLFCSLPFCFCNLTFKIKSAQGQNVYFNNLYEQPYNLPNSGNSVFFIDGKYIVAGNGNDYDFTCFKSSIDLFSIDINGNLEWNKAFGYSTTQWKTSHLIIAPDSGYIFLTTNGFCITPSTSSISLLKLNKAGDSLWSKGVAAGTSQDIKLKNNGEMIISGSFEYYDGVNPDISDFILVKLDQAGNMLWNGMYGDSIKLEAAVSVEFTGNGDYMQFGTIKDSLDALSDIYIVRTDSNGNLLWDKRLLSANDDIIYGSIQLFDANYLVYGLTYSQIMNDRQAFFSKLDSNGNILWEVSFGGIGFESIYDATELPNGDIIAAGTTWLTPVMSNGLLLKLNSSGDSIWTRTFTKQDSVINRFNDVQLTQDGGFIITGESNGDMWLVKVDSSGCGIPDCATGIYNEIKSQHSDIEVFPNPNTGRFYVKMVLQKNTNLFIDLYHYSGQLIYSEKIFRQPVDGNYIQQIDLNGYSKGVYFVKVSTDKNSYTRKIIINQF